jgi:hypothetical protein
MLSLSDASSIGLVHILPAGIYSLSTLIHIYIYTNATAPTTSITKLVDYTYTRKQTAVHISYSLWKCYSFCFYAQGQGGQGQNIVETSRVK